MIASPSDIREPAGYTLARSLFGADIAVAATDPRAAFHRPLPQETGAMSRMVPVRQKSFAAGRVAAHLAMTRLGQPVAPVLMTPDRAPLWPAGLTGSISHSHTCCIAALGRTDQVRALGVDVEEDSDLECDLVPTVCSGQERAWLSVQPPERQGLLAKLIFSAKECAYKCQYPLSNTLFGFETFNVTPDLETGRFTAVFQKDIPQFAAGTRLKGRFVVADGLIMTAMAIRS